jgi:hypothetical protein
MVARRSSFHSVNCSVPVLRRSNQDALVGQVAALKRANRAAVHAGNQGQIHRMAHHGLSDTTYPQEGPWPTDTFGWFQPRRATRRSHPSMVLSIIDRRFGVILV